MRKAIVWILAVIFAAFFFLAAPAQAQAPAPPEPNAGTRIEFSFSRDVNGSAENQASVIGVRVPLTSRWSGQFRTILAPGVGDGGGVQFVLAGAVYSRSLADFFKASSAQFNPSRFEVFGYGEAGSARNAMGKGNASFAYSVGGGLNLKLNDAATLTLIDYNYVRSRILQNGVVFSSSHQIAPGLKLRF